MIARNSAFTYKGKPIDIRRVGEELGVRYAVEGSVRKVGGALRVNVQLVSTETGAHLWADRFDVGRDGAGYGVDDIVRQIAIALNVQLTDVESARGARERPANPDVADLLLHARALSNSRVTPQLLSPGGDALRTRCGTRSVVRNGPGRTWPKSFWIAFPFGPRTQPPRRSFVVRRS